MKVSYVESLANLGLPKGFRMLQYEDKDLLELMKDPTKVDLVTDAVNKYLRQKGGLVDGRWQLAHLLDTKTSVKMKRTTATVDGKETTTVDETEGKYIDRWFAAAVKGDVKEIKVTTSANEEQREAEVATALQKFADQCGDTKEDGTPAPEDEDGYPVGGYAFKLDLSRPERKAGKPKTPPKYAIDGATNIIGNKSEAAWVKKFEHGFTAKTGEKITPIKHESFTVAAPPNATPEQVEAIRQGNIKALAWAITEVEDQKRAQRVADYA